MSRRTEKFVLPSYEDIPVSEHSQVLKQLLDVCHQQQEEIALLKESVAELKDEIAVLKGEKGRPNIKPSTLNKDKDSDKKGGRGSGGRKPKKRNSKGKKSKKVEIHNEKIIEPKDLPEGSVFKGYEDYVVQDIRIEPNNTKIRRARYQTPDGKTIYGELPESLKGSHFGPRLKSYILMQSYQLHVPQKLILQQLLEFGIEISSGQLNRIIIKGHEKFHHEKEEILKVGLEVSRHINTDDTTARHLGRNGYCTHIGNEFFAWFSSTESKSRVNFLELLRSGHTDYVVNKAARDYMQQQKLPRAVRRLLVKDVEFTEKLSWEAYLHSLGITAERHKRIATEGALVASLINHGISDELVIMSDDAGQFNIIGFLNALCWVHAERTINKIIPYSETNRAALENARGQIWDFYQELKDYKLSPNKDKKKVLAKCFDEIFTQKTCFQTLNLALRRIYDNKEELLLVLERPEIPLHNNLSENDIRDYVKKRKISATTRSEDGRRARDTFLSLKKTCQKLGISFWQFLNDRISTQNLIPHLPDIIREMAQAP